MNKLFPIVLALLCYKCQGQVAQELLSYAEFRYDLLEKGKIVDIQCKKNNICNGVTISGRHFSVNLNGHSNLIRDLWAMFGDIRDGIISPDDKLYKEYITKQPSPSSDDH